MKFKKYLLSGIVCLLILFVVSGCLSKEERKEMRGYEAQARENAVEYIKGKYGFTPKVKSADAQEASGGPILGASWLTGQVFVKCKYNSKSFVVYISGKEKTTEGADNYQMDEIIKDTEELFNSLIGLKPYNTVIKYGLTNDYDYTGFISEYYTKNNLKDIIRNNYFSVLEEYINQNNLGYVKNINFRDYNLKDLLLVNYSSKEDYNAFLSKFSSSEREYNYNKNFRSLYYGLQTNKEYVESAYYLNANQEMHID